jgi:hypothetical protein
MWITVDQFLEQLYPERFADLHATYVPQLTTLEPAAE